MSLKPKYIVGDKILLKIGSRPEMMFSIIAVMSGKKISYRVDWTEHGFNDLLNTVSIPEKSIKSAASPIYL